MDHMTAPYTMCAHIIIGMLARNIIIYITFADVAIDRLE
jgi:hypothetical protein